MMDDDEDKYQKEQRKSCNKMVAALFGFALLCCMLVYEHSFAAGSQTQITSVSTTAQTTKGPRSSVGLPIQRLTTTTQGPEQSLNYPAVAKEPKNLIIPGVLPLHENDEMPVGYVVKPTYRDNEKKTVDDGKLHIIFSSGCNYFQHWQSEFLMATAFMAGQRGRLTRIVSGCHDKSAEKVAHRHQTFPAGKNDMLVPLKELKQSANPHMGLFVTPSFEGAKDFPWINKPSSIEYFVRFARDELDAHGEDVIVVLDPDFVFLRPITQGPVQRGDDRGRPQIPGFEADMWAYCMAAAHLKLEHTILDQFMISTWGDQGQSFQWVDAWTKMSCNDPKPQPEDHYPNFIHLASNFKAPKSREWMFHKGHVPADILDCGTPFLIDAPDDTWEISPKAGHVKQNAWVMCHTVTLLNRVLKLYKDKFCPNGYEKRHLVRLIQDKTKDRGCDGFKQKWCWPIAQIEGLPENWRNTDEGKLVDWGV